MFVSLIRSDKHWLLFYLVIVTSWILVALMSKFSGPDTSYLSIYGSDFWLQLCSEPEGFQDSLSLFLMWTIMTAAMMIPTLIPTLKTYQDLIYGGSGTSAGFILIVCGFLLIWVFFSFLASFAQASFAEFNLLNGNGNFVNPVLSSILLSFAGAYQFSSLKESCVSKCRAPLSFFMQLNTKKTKRSIQHVNGYLPF